MSYPDSVRYLYALGNELKAGAKFGLARIRTLLEALGEPQLGERFVHVAGTNGKGSTCALIAAALREQGLRTGLYTSPHLVSPTERIQIDGSAIAPEAFEAAFQKVHAAAEQLIASGGLDAHPSYFETVTAMALLVFREQAEITVLEVGLGGRLDATNVISPELCVITPVHFDHEAFLGNTLAAIAAEKAGILKPGVPLVMAAQEPQAEEVILARAEEAGCAVTRSADQAPMEVEADARGSRFVSEGQLYRCPLAGRHQIENALTAVAACRRLGLAPAIIARGFAAADWPGRLEYVRSNPDFVLDGAHNPSGARALAAYIREFCRNRPVWLVFGTMRDKAIEEVSLLLFPLAQRLILTAVDVPRALRPEVMLAGVEHQNVVTTHGVAAAIREAERAPSGAIVFFTGSLYLVGEARALLAPAALVQ